jgi:hypothetical protein
MSAWTTFWFESNSAWGLADSPETWANIRADWNRGAHYMAPKEIYTASRSWDRHNAKPGTVPNFGQRTEHLGGKMTLGDFFDQHGMDKK